MMKLFLRRFVSCVHNGRAHKTVVNYADGVQGPLLYSVSRCETSFSKHCLLQHSLYEKTLSLRQSLSKRQPLLAHVSQKEPY